MVKFHFTSSSKQLANLLTKVALPQVFSNLRNKLGMLDLYAPAWGEVLNWVISTGLLGDWVVTHIPTLSSIYTLYLLLWKTIYSFWVFLFLYRRSDYVRKHKIELK